MATYYNEIEPYAAEWLRNLIARNLIPAGDVDERSIVDVAPDDIVGYRQCHFFAGIAGWALAARIAGWPDDRELWTGSCPCQPFSEAGSLRGFADERHLWPEFARLIRARKPGVIAGEQVASKAGRAWLSAVRADLEEMGHDVWAADICAAGVGSPQGRQRLYWMADSNRAGLNRIKELHQLKEAGVEASWRRHSDGCGRSAWDSAIEMEGADGSRRLLAPGVQLLADGLSDGVGRRRAYGNAIVPEVGAEVISAYMECRP